MRERPLNGNVDKRQEPDTCLIRSICRGRLRYRDGSPPRCPSLLSKIRDRRVASILLVLATAAPVSAADSERGRRIYERCSSCHVLDEKRNVFGPHLKGIIGRRAGSLPDYAYSQAMRAASEAGLVWEELALRDFLYSPKKKAPGSKMRFWGLRRSEIDDLMAYLKSLK
ncbi:c-type cytochrome [Pararhizobium sp. DWP3-4]|uniref:c-type cytochrome n=1 Tax=Pararhizobium sp. DWP3-4 TaxID=2804565 RepID=UPI003CFA3628